MLPELKLMFRMSQQLLETPTLAEFSSTAAPSQYQLSVSADLKAVTTSKHPHLSTSRLPNE